MGIIKKALIGTALFLALASPLQASKNKVYQDVVVGNCALQGTFAGIGGSMNGNNFFKSFSKGCLGGTLIGASKIAVGKSLDNAWASKMTNALGTSIAYNTSNGKPMFDSFGVDFGFLYFEWKDGFKTYILPDSLASNLAHISDGGKFNLKDSIKYGTPIFYNEKIPTRYNEEAIGLTLTNNIMLEKEHWDLERVKKHELIHTLQYASDRSLGNVLLNLVSEKDYRKKNEEKYKLKIDHSIGSGFFHSIYSKYDYPKSPIEREAYSLDNLK